MCKAFLSKKKYNMTKYDKIILFMFLGEITLIGGMFLRSPIICFIAFVYLMVIHPYYKKEKWNIYSKIWHVIKETIKKMSG